VALHAVSVFVVAKNYARLAAPIGVGLVGAPARPGSTSTNPASRLLAKDVV
jgi:hypothetical protein